METGSCSCDYFKLERAFKHSRTTLTPLFFLLFHDFIVHLLLNFYSSSLHLPFPLFSFSTAVSLLLWVCVCHASRRCNRVKSPWSWNAPTSAFKLDSISTAGSDKRACVQLSQVMGLWRRGGCFEPGLRMRAAWEIFPAWMLLLLWLYCSAPQCREQCFSKPGWRHIAGFCGEIKMDPWIILDTFAALIFQRLCHPAGRIGTVFSFSAVVLTR